MYRAWRRNPPLSVLMQAFVGFKAPEEEKPVDPGLVEWGESWLQDRMNNIAQGKE